MMHYLRIVNARGRQKWHGQDHEDKGHQTLPDWRGNASATVRSRPGLFHASTENCFKRCPLSTGLKQLAAAAELCSASAFGGAENASCAVLRPHQ
jgi:hypothetical protein